MPSMEKPSSESKQNNVPECNLKEWSLRARIGRENPNSRRFSASNLKSFREDERSFRSNINISSTVSSPGYSIKALQAKTVYSWEHMPPDKYTLNSKWNDAERYICNPLSGEVPLQCLSAKTLSERSFRSLITSRITMSAPLIYPSPSHQFQAKAPILEHVEEVEFLPIREKKGSATRDVGVQSTPPELSSGSPTPAATPSIEERSRKVYSETGDSSVSSGKQKSEAEVEVRETRDKNGKGGRERKKVRMMCRCSSSRGCLSLKGLWQRDKCKSRKNIDPTSSPTFLYHVNACYNK